METSLALNSGSGRLGPRVLASLVVSSPSDPDSHRALFSFSGCRGHTQAALGTEGPGPWQLPRGRAFGIDSELVLHHG